MNSSDIKKTIKLCGIGPNYKLYTGGMGGLPVEIYLTNAETGFAIQRALRELAMTKPKLLETVQ